MFNNIRYDQELACTVLVQNDGLCYGVRWNTGESVFCYDGVVSQAKSF